MVQETKVIYHVDEEATPYLVKVGVAPNQITLGDLKSVLRSKSQYKYFFKSKDQDFGSVENQSINQSNYFVVITMVLYMVEPHIDNI
jgi:segment polarity protein dishevelled